MKCQYGRCKNRARYNLYHYGELAAVICPKCNRKAVKAGFDTMPFERKKKGCA